ncbi:hypothetical protein QBC35DRAFT_232040 [Podospora australis]|uniref:Uncharacterized protein n=1 Tax=Podospora australis TaxID=1536484 RepID=A0AAN6WSX2_9PEZI|nr:hypothetical protein QBC35DRAFT_232040 [Podospora australis]
MLFSASVVCASHVDGRGSFPVPRTRRLQYTSTSTTLTLIQRRNSTSYHTASSTTYLSDHQDDDYGDRVYKIERAKASEYEIMCQRILNSSRILTGPSTIGMASSLLTSTHDELASAKTPTADGRPHDQGQSSGRVQLFHSGRIGPQREGPTQTADTALSATNSDICQMRQPCFMPCRMNCMAIQLWICIEARWRASLLGLSKKRRERGGGSVLRAKVHAVVAAVEPK